ncbi:hypothetical protein [Streptomyces sp. NPDC056255]|uniref:hypothetical protein n=1 Tax=Streptomyces sp. NPDC056255 TaxID=3345764 RepID=UPI0035D8978A
MWLLDARPMKLVKDTDVLKFAAGSEVAAACGWRYSVVAGWRPHVWSILDHCPRTVERVWAPLPDLQGRK